eukprot:7187984-Lingulodinium_polyedra.AAC.1
MALMAVMARLLSDHSAQPFAPRITLTCFVFGVSPVLRPQPLRATPVGRNFFGCHALSKACISVAV